MRALIAIDHHFFRTPDGQVFLGPPMSISGYRSWEKYLAIFEEVMVVGRVKQVPQPGSHAVRADGPGVIFYDLPDYLGPWEYVARIAALKRGVAKAITQCDCFILRVPGAIPQLAWNLIRRRGLPCALEVVADPWDMLSRGAAPSVIRPYVRRAWSRQLRKMCRHAEAVCYVTQDALQRRYPPGASTRAASISDVEIPCGIADQAQIETRFSAWSDRWSGNGAKSPLRVGFLGSLTQLYKAPDILLRAAAACLQDGINLELVLAGDGKFRPFLEKLAHEVGIGERVRFLGALTPGRAVFEFLDQIDLFVLPSRQEGLPRAMVEAMSRGCPCVGSTVGGIPELLASEDLVMPGDATDLAGRISQVLSNRQRLEQMSRRNWEKARQYSSSVLSAKRAEFYTLVRRQSEAKASHCSCG